jgi:glycerol-3-phosphate acyltransferase PlsY
MAQGNLSRAAIWLLAAVSTIGLAVSVFDYFWTGNGIHGSLGALIVIGSTLLMAIASAAIAIGFASGRVRSVLAALILLDILGTGFAAYMLEAEILLGLMILALIAWLFSAFSDRRLSRKAATLETAT